MFSEDWFLKFCLNLENIIGRVTSSCYYVFFLFVLLSMVEIKIYLWRFPLFRETILIVTFSYAK